MTFGPGLAAAVILAGGLAAMLRLVVSRRLVGGRSDGVPVGVLVVNAAASMLAGAVGGLLASGRIGPGTALVAVTGVSGGLSTFSTFAVDTVRLIRSRHPSAAIANVVATVGGCTLLCAGSFALTR